MRRKRDRNSWLSSELGPLPTTAPEARKGQRIALAVVMLICLLLAAWIISPLWVGVALGTVMAFTAQTLFRTLARRFGGRPVLAAVVTTGLGGLLLASIGSLVLWVVARELVSIGALLQAKMSSGSLADLAGERTARLVDRLGLDRADVMDRIRADLDRASHQAAAAAAVILQTTTGAILSLIIALLTMYYVLLEWTSIAVRLERILPLHPGHTRALIREFRDVGRAAFVGSVATALVQGLCGWIGYSLAGVPQPVTWAMFTFIASFLPVVGTTMVWAPMVVWLLLAGRPAAAVFIAVWGGLVIVLLCDYVIRPRLVGGPASESHPLLTLVALLGGLEVLGLAGLIVGPMIMSLLLAVVSIYERDVPQGFDP